MDYGKSFSFVFDDKEWMRKLGMGSLVLLVSFLLLIPAIFFMVGYQITVGRHVFEGRKNPLPDTDEFGKVFGDGASAFGIMMVYFLPLFLILCVVIGAMGAAGSLADGDAEALGAALGVVGVVFYCLYLVFALVLGFVAQAALVQYIRHGSFAAAMRFGEVMQILRQNIADFLLTMLCVIAASILVQIVLGVSAFTVCGPFILMFPALLWQSSVGGHLFGQLATQAGGGSDDVNKEEYYDSLM